MTRALGTKPSWMEKLIGTLLRTADANVIAVDWVYGSTGAYYSAVENVVKLGLQISSFLRKLLVGAVEPMGISAALEGRGVSRSEAIHEGKI